MEQEVVRPDERIEAIGRYLAHAFASCGIERYDDAQRNVVGFRFIGAAHGNVEFARDLLETFPTGENELALELHLRHCGSEINATPPGQRVVFTREGQRREPSG
jgi:hypothetical protein